MKSSLSQGARARCLSNRGIKFAHENFQNSKYLQLINLNQRFLEHCVSSVRANRVYCNRFRRVCLTNRRALLHTHIHTPKHVHKNTHTAPPTYPFLSSSHAPKCVTMLMLLPHYTISICFYCYLHLLERPTDSAFCYQSVINSFEKIKSDFQNFLPRLNLPYTSRKVTQYAYTRAYTPSKRNEFPFYFARIPNGLTTQMQTLW